MSNADRLKDYFHRQYESEERSLEKKMAAFFSEDLIYHMGDKTIGRPALTETARMIRNATKEDHTVGRSNAQEEGDAVTFHMAMNVKGASQDGQDVAVDSDFTWRFNEEGQVFEA